MYELLPVHPEVLTVGSFTYEDAPSRPPRTGNWRDVTTRQVDLRKLSHGVPVLGKVEILGRTLVINGFHLGEVNRIHS